MAADEQDCLRQIRRFLSYMPQNVWELPPSVTPTDRPDRCEDALVDIVPRSERQAYNMKKLIAMVADQDSVFEIQPGFGRAVVTALARMNGKVVGIVANNPMFGGIVDVKAARKQTHFIDLCDSFNIPLVFFVDVPGLLIGVQSESDAIMRFGI